MAGDDTLIPSPSLSSLPPPPIGKSGWPWTEETPKQHFDLPDGSSVPRISVVTPSFQQGNFIEETIRSVLLQGYPNLEYIIIDGGSTDSSVEIIQKYSPWLAYWVSERDRGQSHAINKGLLKTTGEYFTWINSDDYYVKSAINTILSELATDNWLLGGAYLVESNLPAKLLSPTVVPDQVVDSCFRSTATKNFRTLQPAHIWSRNMFMNVGLLNEHYHYCMDFDWMLRALSMGYKPKRIQHPIVNMRIHTDSKSERVSWLFELERSRIFLAQGFRGDLRLIPSINAARIHLARALYKLNERLLIQRRNLLAKVVQVIAIAVSFDMINLTRNVMKRFNKP